MSRIRLLPETVASQVAAGEVIERPASVVKELVENSIDAGARKIDILIRRGGISMVQAIGHADVAFSFARDDRVIFQLPATAALTDRIRDLYGTELLAQLLSLNSSPSPQIRISGMIGRAGLSRQTRAQQLIFVNRRAIESPLITAAIREGYHTALMKGQYPVTFLFLELDPGAVDVNVHPAKREVRFRDPNGVREAVVRCIQATLARGRADWQKKFRAPPAQVSAQPTVDLILRPQVSVPEVSHRELPQFPTAEIVGLAHRLPVPPADSARSEPDWPSLAQQKRVERAATPQFQIIGVLNKLYVLMENVDGLVLVDQHAAHERILFEELRRRMEEQGVPSQKLLITQTFELLPRDADWIEQNMSILQKMGIGIESFGPNTFKIDSLPGCLNVTDGAECVRKVIDDLKSASDRSSPLRLGEDMIAKSVCRHAVKANDPLRYLEVEKLLQDLLECDLPYCCPHGRPTMIQISLAELEKKFGRKV